MDITISIPNDMATQFAQADLAGLMTLNFIIDQYRQGNVTLKRACRWADLEEVEFLTECQQRGVSRQTYESIDELTQEVEMALAHLAQPQ
ncbi:UPF0175 family protein [Psychrobacter sp. I-STPA10]|uniref:UPF0175 family protein n=1 Tax=Psychrobacter sp. I-STPA10 TaxID=2585769 RepID=UPI001E49156B|nr:UPF0175 family protein [Psychrobacter sp. I-STPA10]